MMLSSQYQSRCCDAYLRSESRALKRRTSTGISSRRDSTRLRPRVLVVEYRDEVYAGLKALLEEHGSELERAELGATVASSFSRFVPDLVLINEDMPDESGWLITCKLRITRHRQPVWLYTVREPRLKADWKEFTGVDEVIEYGGVIMRLVQDVRQRLAEWPGRRGDRSASRRCMNHTGPRRCLWHNQPGNPTNLKNRNVNPLKSKENKNVE